MMLLDFEGSDAVLHVRSAGARASGARRAAPKHWARALGAMKARWYVASKMEGWGIACAKELLELHDSYGALTLYQTADALDRNGAASIPVQDRLQRFRMKLLRGNTGS